MANKNHRDFTKGNKGIGYSEKSKNINWESGKKYDGSDEYSESWNTLKAKGK